MVLIPAGSFTMGDTLDGELDAIPTNVYVSAFYMDTSLMSYSQWQTVYSWATQHGYIFDNAASGKAANHPVQRVDWYDVVKWGNARSQQAGLLRPSSRAVRVSASSSASRCRMGSDMHAGSPLVPPQ
jgi:formylglycine-generating enzyme required for sulfatase activity